MYAAIRLEALKFAVKVEKQMKFPDPFPEFMIVYDSFHGYSANPCKGEPPINPNKEFHKSLRVVGGSETHSNKPVY